MLGKFIKLFGSVLFMSDNIAEYDEKQLETFKDILTDDSEIKAINVSNNIAFIDYVQNGKDELLKFNINDGTIF